MCQIVVVTAAWVVDVEAAEDEAGLLEDGAGATDEEVALVVVAAADDEAGLVEEEAAAELLTPAPLHWPPVLRVISTQPCWLATGVV